MQLHSSHSWWRIEASLLKKSQNKDRPLLQKRSDHLSQFVVKDSEQNRHFLQERSDNMSMPLDTTREWSLQYARVLYIDDGISTSLFLAKRALPQHVFVARETGSFVRLCVATWVWVISWLQVSFAKEPNEERLLLQQRCDHLCVWSCVLML